MTTAKKDVQQKIVIPIQYKNNNLLSSMPAFKGTHLED